MPSPFPGMDPFIEGQKWRDFHSTFIPLMREQLLPRLRPKYYADIEEHVYVEREPDDPRWVIEPDLSVSEPAVDYASVSVTAATVAGPVECVVPWSEPARQIYAKIRRTDKRTVVAVIEMLSPANKRPGSDGYKQYRKKRDQVLASSAHLVEIDLLRGGRRMALGGRLPPGDFRVLVSRARRRPRAAVYVWPLEQRLPVIAIPLCDPDPDVSIDLQEVFTQVYDRAGYDYALDYQAPIKPPLEPERLAWVRALLSRRPAAIQPSCSA